MIRVQVADPDGAQLLKRDVSLKFRHRSWPGVSPDPGVRRAEQIARAGLVGPRVGRGRAEHSQREALGRGADLRLALRTPSIGATGHAAILPEFGGPRERSEGTRLNSSHVTISYAVFCLKKK